jgi:hypothetical protein
LGIYDDPQARIVDRLKNGGRLRIGTVNDDYDFEFAPSLTKDACQRAHQQNRAMQSWDNDGH